jgi:alkanesulfonate monooxygenase SsuD/methylene tetrahydromethanopterin reductase-like flavin-dependent oxidoreductase (luciferase family)
VAGSGRDITPIGYSHFCSHEHFPPDALLQPAVAAERAGFDGISCSDHLQPWWEPGESGHAWVWLGAAGQATERVPIGTGVTPPGPRYHPVLIAQAWATLEKGRRWELSTADFDLPVYFPCPATGNPPAVERLI